MSLNITTNNLTTNPCAQDVSIQKAQRMILDFNKNGLNYLSSQKTHSQALEYFKKAQKTIIQQLKINPQNKKINQLAAITFNNLACYYKKANKPKVALSYLKKALEIEVFKVQNWISTASTHLNICAIYSFMKKHQEAAQHAILALKMLQKVVLEQIKDKKEDEKSYWNVKMLSQYNAAIQFQYLKKYEESEKYYQETKEIAIKNQKKNEALLKSCDEGIERVKQQIKMSKQRLLQLLTKRKQNEQKGNHEFMRKNKKNYHNSKDDWRTVLHNRKYLQYKIETEHTSSSNKGKKYQSAGKLTAIKPILHMDNPSKELSLHTNNNNNRKSIFNEKTK